MLEDDDSWRDRAACRGMYPGGPAQPEDAGGHIFFPHRHKGSSIGMDTRIAKAVCKSCPVQDECEGYSIRSGEQFGVWGLMPQRERRRRMKVVKERNRERDEDGDHAA